MIWLLTMIIAQAEEITPEKRSNHWLVIIHSSDDGKVPVPLTDKLRAADVTPVALNSSRYKNLMPCWNIIIAGSSEKKNEANALSKKLKRKGIDNYIKLAGEYVGQNPRIDRLCSNAKTDIIASPYYILKYIEKNWYVPLTVRPASLERLKEQYDKDLKSIPTYDFELWMGQLPIETVDTFRVGQVFQTIQIEKGQESLPCTIENFFLAEQGTSSMLQGEEDGVTRRINGCSEHKVYAQLNCPTENKPKGTWFATSDPSLPPIWSIGDSSPTTLNKEWLPKHLKEAQEAAKEQDAPLKIETMKYSLVPLAKSKGKAESLVSVIMYTNSGHDYCGGEDVNIRQTSIFSENQPIVPFYPVFDYGDARENIRGVIQNPDGTLLYMTTSWPTGYAIFDSSGNLFFGNFVPYCGCDC